MFCRSNCGLLKNFHANYYWANFENVCNYTNKKIENFKGAFGDHMDIMKFCRYHDN